MMKLQVGKRYKIRDGGTITTHSAVHNTEQGTVTYRCTTETGETVFYDQYGRILPTDGGKELARYNVEGERRGS
jgi:hypothetical protein